LSPRLPEDDLQFFITTEPCDFLDGKHVVFGKVIDGMLTLRKIENVPTGPNNRPKLAVKITGMFITSSSRRFFISNSSFIRRVRGNVSKQGLLTVLHCTFVVYPQVVLALRPANDEIWSTSFRRGLSASALWIAVVFRILMVATPHVACWHEIDEKNDRRTIMV
jgi:Cyclophilin type peptidyl-prolyl cis-trans isomerase/CLD